MTPTTDVLDGKKALGASNGHIQGTQFRFRYVRTCHLFEMNVRHG